MARAYFWHRVRFKLLLVSLTLLGIPLAGYLFIQETEQFLRDAQDQALQTTASSVANVMHGHDNLFHGVARPGSVLTFRNLFLHPLDKAPQLDGYRDEWVQFEENLSVLESIDARLAVQVFAGQHDRYLYLLIGVHDPQVDYGEAGDSVELALTDRDGALQRYRIQPRAPGWVEAQRLAGERAPPTDPANLIEPQPQPPMSPDIPIRGEWQKSADGYTLELRLPRARLQDRLSLRVHDSASGQVLASGHMFPADALGRLVEPSSELQPVLAGITPPATRIWVTDHQGLVLAQAGRLDANAPLSADQPRMPWFIQELILAVLPRDADAVADLDDQRTQLFIRPVVDALSGRPTSLRRKPSQGNAVVVSAAVPIRSSAGVQGAVLVEQTTNAILSIQNLALQRLFGVTLLFFAVTSLGLLVFASLLASRITRLRDRVEAAVSHDGRIIGPLHADGSLDEIGDLGRSFASVLERLREYNHYLEAMASRLAHELRTPLAVVRSSLDHADQAASPEQLPYLERARDGAQRLERILARLREATGLEQALQHAQSERFDLAALLRRQVEGLRGSCPQTAFELVGAASPVEIDAVPDLLSQAIDKLVGNAVDFHRPGSPIVLRLGVTTDTVLLSIFNEGPALPAGVDVFQSMVSARDSRHDEPHLGLGLYLVRLIAEFHRGSVQAHDRTAPAGVEVTLALPRHGLARG